MSATVRWSGTVTAASSLAHGGESRGTITLLRREAVVQPDGERVWLPVVSGNAVKGRLRRLGEELLRDVLAYEGELTLPAAAFLTSGGAMTKTGREPLTGDRLRRLRELVPHVGVFGGATGSRMLDGAARVGKLVPLVREAGTVLGRDDVATASAFGATQLELYTRTDAAARHGFTDLVGSSVVPLDVQGRPVVDDLVAEGGPMMFRVETFPAGTRFDWWCQLERASDLEVAFFREVLGVFGASGQVGGRGAIGHGLVRADLVEEHLAGAPREVDWRAVVAARRGEALEALRWIS